jgi:hypothetical protein
MEVHHIIQEADGGPNGFENAIPLCFECHAWAGHYNDRHPKGYKFTPTHLRKSRDEWYAAVANGLPQRYVAKLHPRYLLCRNPVVSLALLEGRLDLAPFPDSMLVENQYGAATREMLRRGVDTKFPGDSYGTIDEYRAQHVDAIVDKTMIQDYPYYKCVRRCKRSDEGRLGDLNHTLLKAGASLEDLCVAVVATDMCAGGGFDEIYETRPPWALFVALTNVSESKVTLTHIDGTQSPITTYRPFEKATEQVQVGLPKCSVLPGQTILVPTGLLLGPIEPLAARAAHVRTVLDEGEHSEELSLQQFEQSPWGRCRLVGPHLSPERIFLIDEYGEHAEAVHDLDPNSVYTIDREWHCGSCPHLFTVSANGQLLYQGEVIATGQNKTVTEEHVLPEGTQKVVIAELEDEQTLIERLELDGTIIRRDIRLHTGDVVIIAVANARQLRITGLYTSDYKPNRLNGPSERNRLVLGFMRDRRFAASIKVATKKTRLPFGQ